MHTGQVFKSQFQENITYSQIMDSGEVLKSQLYIVNITCSQIIHTEQVFKSQFEVNITCNQVMAHRTGFKITI